MAADSYRRPSRAIAEACRRSERVHVARTREGRLAGAFFNNWSRPGITYLGLILTSRNVWAALAMVRHVASDVEAARASVWGFTAQPRALRLADAVFESGFSTSGELYSWARPIVQHALVELGRPGSREPVELADCRVPDFWPLELTNTALNKNRSDLECLPSTHPLRRAAVDPSKGDRLVFVGRRTSRP